MEISNETRQKIEEGIQDWNKKDSNARKRFEEAKRPWKIELDSMSEAIAASEQISQEDLAIQINTRD